MRKYNLLKKRDGKLGFNINTEGMKEEIPLVLTILQQSGTPLFTFAFHPDWKFNDISSFMIIIYANYF